MERRMWPTGDLELVKFGTGLGIHVLNYLTNTMEHFNKKQGSHRAKVWEEQQANVCLHCPEFWRKKDLGGADCDRANEPNTHSKRAERSARPRGSASAVAVVLPNLFIVHADAVDDEPFDGDSQVLSTLGGRDSFRENQSVIEDWNYLKVRGSYSTKDKILKKKHAKRPLFSLGGSKNFTQLWKARGPA